MPIKKVKKKEKSKVDSIVMVAPVVSEKVEALLEGEAVVVKDEVHDHGPPLSFPSSPCMVGMSLGRTFNLGNFNSAKINISLTMPCKPDEIDFVCDYVNTWVQKRMTFFADQHFPEEGEEE